MCGTATDAFARPKWIQSSHPTLLCIIQVALSQKSLGLIRHDLPLLIPICSSVRKLMPLRCSEIFQNYFFVYVTYLTSQWHRSVALPLFPYAALCCVAVCCETLYSVTLCCLSLCYITSWYKISCYVALCYVALCCTGLWCVPYFWFTLCGAALCCVVIVLCNPLLFLCTVMHCDMTPCAF